MIEWATDSTGDCGRPSLGLEAGDRSTRGLLGTRLSVLVAATGSRAASEAIAFAAELASGAQGVLRIVHVVAPVEYRVGRLAPMRPVSRKLMDPFDSPVLAGARELAWRRGVAATLALVAGEPARAIVATAVQAQADVLVIGAGSHRRSLGRRPSTTRWVEAHATCPVLTPHSAVGHGLALVRGSRESPAAAQHDGGSELA